MIDNKAVWVYNGYSNATARAVFLFAQTSYFCYHLVIWPRSNKAASAVAKQRKTVDRGQTLLNAKIAAMPTKRFTAILRKVVAMLAGFCNSISRLPLSRKRFLKICNFPKITQYIPSEQSGGFARPLLALNAAGYSNVPPRHLGDTRNPAGDTSQRSPIAALHRNIILSSVLSVIPSILAAPPIAPSLPGAASPPGGAS